MITFDKIDIITVAKVGSSDIFNSVKQKYKAHHGHSLLHLKNVLKNDKNTLIVVGIRNPIDRNLSYLFQTYNNNFYNDVKTKTNKYNGEMCYIHDMNYDTDTNSVINMYFNQTYHNTFNEWFDEFFEITNINNKQFNKEKGLDFYKFPNNNTIMLYTLEKVNNNKDEICKVLGIDKLLYTSNRLEKIEKNLYIDTKKQIVYTQTYLDQLLDTHIMKYFYTEPEIKKMYTKYIVK